jgi:SAM-dependent methyltransferase
MTDLERYAERYTAQYELHSFETVLVRIRRRHVTRWLSQYGARRILEVGCGLEPLFPHYDEFEAWRTVEPVARFAGRARELAAGDARVEVREGRLEEQANSIAGEDFDFIVVSGLLHEVSRPADLLDAVRSLCSDTTVVHSNVPNMSSFHRLLALEMGLIEDVFEPSGMDRAFERHGRFDSQQFSELLTGAGFRIIESGSYFVKPFTNEQMDAVLRTGVFSARLLDGLDGMVKYMPDHGCELYANARRA